MTTGLLISHRGQFEGGRGGTQICSHEYEAAIKAAGISVSRILLDVDQRPSTRLLKKVVSSAYLRTTLPHQQASLMTRASQAQPDFVFINQVNLASLAPQLRGCLPATSKIVLLSHGLESTDLLHFIRLRDKLPLSGRARPTADLALGLAVRHENAHRTSFDEVFVLSETDAVLEEWIGARRLLVVPRVVRPRLLDWKPAGNRLGYVGSLDHAPNLEGLVLALETLGRLRPVSGGARVRVVGGPPGIGTWLAARYLQVDYLGPLTDAELAAEAATWNAFIHPIFCGARGCSTKLADPIAWGIPIVTTRQGHRGYKWSRGRLGVADTPDAFAAHCLAMLDLGAAQSAREQVLEVLGSSPSLEDVAASIAAQLGLPGRTPPQATVTVECR